MRRALIPLICFLFAIHLIDATAQTYASGACAPIPNSQTCVDSTPCKLDSSGLTVCLSGAILPTGALSVGKSCWQYSYQYACSGASPVDTCTAYENNSACSLTASSCQDTIGGTSTCDSWNYTYQCQTAAAKSTTQAVCTNGSIPSSLNYSTPSNPNSTFAQAAVALEIIRQAQLYNEAGLTIFNGVAETCRKGYFGLQNCCVSTPGAQSNSMLMHAALPGVFSVVKYAGEAAVDTVSPYMFDAMYTTGLYTDGMQMALLSSPTVLNNASEDIISNINDVQATGTNFAANGLSLGAYGFTFGMGSVEGVAGGGLFGGDMLLTPADGLFGGGEGYIAFNPYVFAAVVAIQVIQSLSSCSQEEQILGMHKGANLSYFSSESCTNKIPIIGTCLQYTDTYCSFNSQLAELINYQGKQQLGISTTSCGGLTLAQITAIDFTKINLSSMTVALVDQATQAMPKNIGANYTPIMQNSTSGSAQGSSTLPTYTPSK